MTCICQNSSVAGRQPPGEDVGEGCSVPAAYQIGRSSISNILGNSWGLPIHVLRVFWIFLLQWGRRFAPPSWLRLDRRHCIYGQDILNILSKYKNICDTLGGYVLCASLSVYVHKRDGPSPLKEADSSWKAGRRGLKRGIYWCQWAGESTQHHPQKKVKVRRDIHWKLDGDI